MEQGISQVELARKLSVNEMTIVNWEVKGRVPQAKRVRQRLGRMVEGVGTWLNLA